MKQKIILSIAILSLLSLSVFVSAFSCGDGKCEELSFDLTNDNPSVIKQINGHSEEFTYNLKEETVGRHISFTPELLINGKSYVGSYDPLYKEKGYYPEYSVIYTGEMVTYEVDGEEYKNEKPSGIKVQIKESFYCKASDCRKKQAIINVEQGWNLIQQYQVWFQDFSQTTCNFNSNGVGFFYNPFQNDYMHTNFRSTDAIEANLYDIGYFGFSSEEYYNKLGTYQFVGDFNSFWVHSEEPCKIVLNYPDYYESDTPPDSLQLFSENTGGNSRKLSQGWNFLSVYTLLNGNNLESIKGDCSFEKAYSFNANSQDWEQIQVDYKFSSSDIGKGIVVKTMSECTPKFKVGSSSQPPSIPN